MESTLKGQTSQTHGGWGWGKACYKNQPWVVFWRMMMNYLGIDESQDGERIVKTRRESMFPLKHQGCFMGESGNHRKFRGLESSVRKWAETRWKRELSTEGFVCYAYTLNFIIRSVGSHWKIHKLLSDMIIFLV